MHESQERMHKIYENFIPEFNGMREQIRAQLTPEQATKFESVFKQREDWRKRNPGDGKPRTPKHETNLPSMQRNPADAACQGITSPRAEVRKDRKVVRQWTASMRLVLP